MAQPSTLHPLSGPLAGQHLEFHGDDVMIGSAADCAVRIDAPGVGAHHARIVIDAIGATIHRGDGPVGVNDDVVLADARLRSGDFVWLGEPGAETSIMLQFTLGDGLPAPAVAEAGLSEAGSGEAELMEEMAPEDLAPLPPEGIDEVMVEEAPPQPAELVGHEAVEFEASPDEVPSMESPVEHAEILEAHEPEPIAQIEESFDEPAPAPAPPSAPAKVPPAPWQMATAPEPDAAPADYASAWESPAKPAAPEPAPVVQAPPPPPAPAPPPAPPVPRVAAPASGAVKRPATPPSSSTSVSTSAKARTEALRTPVPAPPSRTTSSTPMIVGGLVAVVVLAAGAYFLTSGSPAPAPPAPTPAPTAVVVATPPPALPVEEPAVEAPTPEAAVATPEPSAMPTPTKAAPAGPTPRVASTPTPRATPTPGRPGPTTPTATNTPAPVSAPVNPVPKLLDDARAAVAAKDWTRAAQLFDQALGAEPGNAQATAGKAEVAARLAGLARKFNMAATRTLGGKAAKGPTGFDLGGGGAVKTDYSGQIRCTIAPASVEPGLRFTVQCSLLNIGAKAFKIESVTGNETIDSAAAAARPGLTPKQELAPRAEAVILELSGSWTAVRSWSLDVVAKTNKDESFRALYSWR